MRVPEPKSGSDASPFRLALFWLGIQAVWGALLGISLQARTTELSPGNAQIATNELATAGAFVAAVVQILVGFLSDARRRSGSRRIEFYALGAAGGAIALLVFYDAATFAQLAIAFVALQATLNLAIGPYQAIIPDFIARERVGVASSWMAALQSAGNAIGALAASFITNARALGASLSALLLATFAVTATQIRGRSMQTADTAQERPKITRPFVDLFISRALVYVGFYTLLFNLFFYVRGVLGAETIAGAKELTGILIVSFTIVGAAGAALAARPSDRTDKRVVATLGGAGFVIALLLFIASHAVAGAAAAAVVAGIGWGVFLVADWAIACRVLPSGAMASAMGVWNLAIVIPQVLAPALTSWVLAHLALAEPTVAPKAAFALALVETCIGIVWLWRLPRQVIET
jgi:maltose/moltooligosaccharide transporter